MHQTHTTTHSQSYWHVRLLKGDELVNGIGWIVAVDKADPTGHITAMARVRDRGMLPTNYTYEALGGSGHTLLPGYELDVEYIEWECNGEVARLF